MYKRNRKEFLGLQRLRWEMPAGEILDGRVGGEIGKNSLVWLWKVPFSEDWTVFYFLSV